MSNTTELWNEWEGKIVPRAFSPGYVVLSYVVSYVGAATTLELFNIRTAGRGLYNWSLLFGSSISMGGVSIWCMHFISNKAIVLIDGQASIQIAYSPLYTALSFLVPILVLLAAFFTLGSDDQVSIIRVTIGGTMAGLAICGMHYLGQAGISNYTCVYHIGNVVGSAVVAVVASIVALTVFFVLRATWTDSLWKRLLCAIILAGAVMGMHWLASVGTQYRLRQFGNFSHKVSGNSTVIVVIVLSITSCFILIAFAMLAQRRKAQSADRARQVALACAVFDSNGKIMVTPDGLLPSQQVTSSYIELSLDDVFGINHPVFHWIYRATRHWSSVSSLLPGMRRHVNQASTTPGFRTESDSEVDLNGEESKPVEGYSLIFRELFCLAASELAQQLNEPLEDVGVLYDEIFNTGSTGKAGRAPTPIPDLERDGKIIQMHGKGQLLFLVRRADRNSARRLAAHGYRFADIHNVAPLIGRRMQINCADVEARLNSMYEYSDDTQMLKPGVHLACFALRARVRSGFEVLVRKDARNQLPTMQLPFDTLEPWMHDYLRALDGRSVSSCIKFLRTKPTKAPIAAPQTKEQIFANQFLDTLLALEEEINEPLFSEAILIAKPVSAPCSSWSRNSSASRLVNNPQKPGLATLVAFRCIFPIQYKARGMKVEFTPLSFFREQQFVYRNSADHEVFARKVHKEFGPILNRERASVDAGSRNTKTKHAKIRRVKSGSRVNLGGQLESWMAGDSKDKDKSDTSSERKLVETSAFGGIMVSQEVSVEVKEVGLGPERRSTDAQSGLELEEMPYGQMGTRGRVTRGEDDPETYVDLLFAACMNSR